MDREIQYCRIIVYSFRYLKIIEGADWLAIERAYRVRGGVAELKGG